MPDTISGVFDYLDKEYPFVLHDRVIKIAQTPFQYNTDFEDITDIDYIQGVTSNNKDIVFFGCKVYCSERLFLSTEIAITIQGYILLRNSQTDYDRIDFYSPAINGFYSPRNAYTVETKEQFVATGITLREKDAYRKTFNCKINGEELQIGLDIYVSLNLNFTEEKLGTARSVFYMAFQSKKTPADISRYYLYLRDFLAFINFRNDIPIDEMQLFSRNELGKYEPRGEVIVFQKDTGDYKPDAFSTITHADLSDEHFPTLFQNIAQKRLRETFNPFLYPESKKEDRYVDASKWLNTAISFESEFNLSFPDFKAQKDLAFCQAKDMLLAAIENTVKQSGKSINNKENAALKSFRHLIEHADTTIKEKFQICESIFETETKDAIVKIRSACNVPAEIDLSEAYAAFRNHTAHGEVRKPENIDVATYRILRCFIYVLNLKRADVPSEQIKAIVQKMF